MHQWEATEEDEVDMEELRWGTSSESRAKSGFKTSPFVYELWERRQAGAGEARKSYETAQDERTIIVVREMEGEKEDR